MNLENLGVQEMNAKEIREVDGGDFGFTLLAGLIITAAVEIIGDWEHFKDGLLGR